MSLINDALRDLDSRVASDADDVAAKPDAFHGQTKPPKHSRGYWLPILVGAIVVGAYPAYDIYKSMPDAPESSIANAITDTNAPLASVSPSIVDSNVSEKVESAVLDTSVSAPEAASVDATVASVPVEGNALPIRALSLIANAEEAIARNRLSVPERNNALHFLEQLTLLYPQNSLVNARVAQMRSGIRADYEDQLNGALANNNHSRGVYLLSRSEKFGLSAEQKQVFEQSLLAIKPATSDRPQAPSTAAKPKSMLSAASKTDALEPVNKQRGSWVTLTSVSQELGVIAEAKAHLNRGAQAEAERVLSQYVDETPASIEARSFLFDHYIATRRVDKAQGLLSELPQDHALQTYFNAQIANLARGPERAIAILESTAPGERVSTQHRILLAGLYQKTSRHQEAFDLYKGLLREDESSLVALLGFALSADNLGDGPASLAAYRRIAYLGHPNESVRLYVEKRINTLQKNDLAEATPW